MRRHSTQLVALTGPAGCGKTSVAQELETLGFVRVRFAGPLKAMLRALGLSEAQVDGDEKQAPSALLCGRSPRYAMQTLGTEWGRDLIGSDVWVNAAMARVDALLAAGRSVVIDDLRFNNEARALAERGATIVRLTRAQSKVLTARSAAWRTRARAVLRAALRLPRLAPSHASEAGVSPKWLSATVTNDGALAATVQEVLSLVQTGET